MSDKKIKKVNKKAKEDSDKKKKKDEEEFSIGDTKLARGNAVQTWGSKNLEEKFSDENLESEGFEVEEMGEEDSSYEAKDDNEREIGLEIAGDDSLKDLYGSTKRDDSVSMYNTGGGTASESSLYKTSTTKRKPTIGDEYKMKGPKKKSSVRRGPKSGLETGIRKTRRSKGVSLF